MTDKPILFSGEMVRAIIEGRKSQTRRVLKPQPKPLPNAGPFYRPSPDVSPREWVCLLGDYQHCFASTAYAPGDRLWVRETHAIVPRTAYRMSEGVQQTLRPNDHHDAAIYRQGWERCKPGPWKPSIFMPRWASRLTLTVTDVKVERVQDISEEDAEAEGWPAPEDRASDGVAEIRDAYPIGWFAHLWDSLNKKRGFGWEKNPWVAAISFEVHRCNIDAHPCTAGGAS